MSKFPNERMTRLVSAMILVLVLPTLSRTETKISAHLPSQYTLTYSVHSDSNPNDIKVTLSSDGQAQYAKEEEAGLAKIQLYTENITYYSSTLPPSLDPRGEMHPGPVVAYIGQLPLLVANILGVDGFKSFENQKILAEDQLELSAQSLAVNFSAKRGQEPHYNPVTLIAEQSPIGLRLLSVNLLNTGDGPYEGKLNYQLTYDDYRPLGSAYVPGQIKGTRFRSGGANIQTETAQTVWTLESLSEKPLDPSYFDPSAMFPSGTIIQDERNEKTIAFTYDKTKPGSPKEQSDAWLREQTQRDEEPQNDSALGIPPIGLGLILIAASSISYFVWLKMRSSSGKN